jgi:hypothetical protein
VFRRPKAIPRISTDGLTEVQKRAVPVRLTHGGGQGFEPPVPLAKRVDAAGLSGDLVLSSRQEDLP